MDRHFDADADRAQVFEILAPPVQTLPLVLASPHSGSLYPPEFLAAAKLDGFALRKSEDSFVDEIFLAAPLLGAPLIRALFPRAFLDANREAFELDPEMFADALPAYVNTRSPRVAAGLGTIAKVVANGEEIYRGKLRFADALGRVNRFYHPYHAALKRLVDQTRHRFGYCVLIDCHSMPSGGAPGEGPSARSKVDFVLGDCYGSSCLPQLIETAERTLRDQGFVVNRNTPYAGGFTTRHYGRPRMGIHALQIEINRALYMDERAISRKPYIEDLADHMERLVDVLSKVGVPKAD
ncbi:N-formylglutamate amidohydrolase [Skermanella stibiiresistens SB22]|uniref:N-formylglutamate amidohydrolase n=1 Tax=Skermanella stibiiresistens SB22 TaxID=1385369 RepID=W9H8K0_9PROT|nr:N-formylglutamate amidohydrolase [Skermanella stibiiresistens]EWY41012.1 N-formylglutamate amidohydrolase [Skermanella stibiiresistens SB22]